jgi:hypothetical protein
MTRLDKTWMMFAAICISCTAGPSLAQPISLAPAAMPALGTVDVRYQSFNVEMAEVVGGNFWKPYAKKGQSTPGPGPANSPSRPGPSRQGGPLQQIGEDSTLEPRPPIDLADPRLRKLAAALGPAFVRVSGTSANSVYFHDANTPPPTAPSKGFTSILTRNEWKSVVDFAAKVDAKLVTSFAFSPGVRNDAGVWTTDQAESLLDYTKSVGGEIAAVEFVNEPNLPTEGGAPPGYSVSAYARDFAIFQRFIKAKIPRMPIAGPGTVGEGDALSITATSRPLFTTLQILAALAPPRFDIFSYHSYPAASVRCAFFGHTTQTVEEDALSDEWLARSDPIHAFYLRLRDRYEPGRPAWVTETADAACGGNPWASTFLDSFRYLNQLGWVAKMGVQVVFHNTLASSDYGLLDQDTFKPRPNYWAALLWHKLMGTKVLDAGRPWPGLKLYAHCLPGYPGGVTILAINNSRIDPRSLELSLASQRYRLTSQPLDSPRVELNGNEIKLQANDELPTLQGEYAPPGYIELPPASITFLAVPDARNADCK